MRKPNYKRRGMANKTTKEQQRVLREAQELERKIKCLPLEIRDFARQHPGLAY